MRVFPLCRTKDVISVCIVENEKEDGIWKQAH